MCRDRFQAACVGTMKNWFYVLKKKYLEKMTYQILDLVRNEQ